MTDDRQICILRTSCDVLNKFSINDSNSLIHEEIKDGEIISQNHIANNIKNYSAAIDSEDKIHIIYTKDNINLKYVILTQSNNIIDIVSAKSDLTLRCISIKILVTNPHIFFTLTDVQHNRHVIFHSSFINGYWQSKEISQAIGPRYIQPYLLELHNEEIYILLYLSHPEGKLALYKLENSKDQWIDIDRNIELKDSCNVSFFISPMNMAIIAYNKLIDKNFQTIIIYRNLTTKPYEPWRSLVLSDKDTSTLKPSIFFNKEEYYMTGVQGAKVVLKRSKDLISWEDVITFDKYSNDYLKCFYMSNNSQDSSLKINSMYLSNTINLNPLINLDFRNEIPKEYLPLDSGQTYTNFSEAKLELLDKELEKKTYENNLMKNTINYLNSIISQYEDHMTGLNNSQTPSVQDINIHRNNFLDKIISIKKENDTLLLYYNDKLWQLFRLIQEKDSLINDLYDRIDK